MHIDTNSIPDDFNTQDFLNKWKQQRQTIMVSDITKTIPGYPNTTTTTTTDGIWSQINNTHASSSIVDDVDELKKQIKITMLDNKLLKLRLLALEGKFEQSEVVNIRKMLMSEDEASKTLAITIIDNA